LNRLTDVLLAPNAALRFRPAAEQILPEFRDAWASAAEGQTKPKEEPRAASGPGADGAASGGRAALWLPAGEHVRPLAVKAGPSDGALTEVSGEKLTEGMEVVTGVQPQASAKAGTSNPFTPSFSRGGSTAGAGRPR
jgi:HlyD family secretion protein